MKKFISIAAMSLNNVIAVDGEIPWHLPNDFKHFKEITLNSYIIMGRKTYESLPGVLMDRIHIVVTRNKDYQVDPIFLNSGRVIVVGSLQEAFNYCPNNSTSFIIGGGEIYTEAMPFVDELNLTIVDAIIDEKNMTLFPELSELNDFEEHLRVENSTDKKHKYSYSFVRMKRKTKDICLK